MFTIHPAAAAAVAAISAAEDAIVAAPGRVAEFVRRIATASDADWAVAAERTVRVIATVITFVWVIGTLTAECCYSVGGQLRLALEDRNDQLSAFWRTLWVGADLISAPTTTQAPTATTQAPTAPTQAPTASRRIRRFRPTAAMVRSRWAAQTLPFLQPVWEPAVYVPAADPSAPSLADLFLAASQAMAESDARLYRSVSDHIARCKAILAEAETDGMI